MEQDRTLVSRSLPDMLEKLLSSFDRYYNVNRETPLPPFAAEAFFRLHDEQYFLVKSAKLSEADSREIVFFATTEHLTLEVLHALDEKAWTEGLSRVVLDEHHRNTDILLIILCNQMDPEVKKAIRRLSRYKSYCFGFKGWSHYRLIAAELPTETLSYNRQGRLLEKTLRHMFLA